LLIFNAPGEKISTSANNFPADGSYPPTSSTTLPENYRVDISIMSILKINLASKYLYLDNYTKMHSTG
jgi:hypothetical protein